MKRTDFSLRPLSVEDAALTLAWRNRPDIRAAMFNDAEIPADGHARWIARVTDDPTCSYHIFEYRDQPVGSVGLYGISRQHSRAEWTFHIGEPDAVKSAGTIMLFLALEHCFERLGLEKLCAEVLSNNPKSARVHDRLGFHREGNRLRHLRRGGSTLDVALYALFSEQWRASRPALAGRLFPDG